jgi:hypothetical protein
MNETYERLRTKLVFDPMCLDEELIELPMLIMDASELAAEKLAEHDRKKNAHDVTTAEASDDLRSEMISDAKGNDKKRSEAQITSEVFLHISVQESLAALEVAKYELALAQALVNSMRAKKDSLKTFAELTISGYLSPNSVLTDRRSEMRTASNNVVRRRPITQKAADLIETWKE